MAQRKNLHFPACSCPEASPPYKKKGGRDSFHGRGRLPADTSNCDDYTVVGVFGRDTEKRLETLAKNKVKPLYLHREIQSLQSVWLSHLRDNGLLSYQLRRP